MEQDKGKGEEKKLSQNTGNDCESTAAGGGGGGLFGDEGENTDQ